MKREELKKAYYELNFTADLQETYFRNITSSGGNLQRRKRIRPVPILLCVLLAGTTIYAADKFDLLKWYYGDDAKIIRNLTDGKPLTDQNEHLKMSVEDAVFTGEYGMAFVHIQALDAEGNTFMKQNQDSLSVNLSVENEELQNKVGTALTSRFCEEISDEGNWYYRVQTVNHKSVEKESSDMARVTFPGSDSLEDGNLADSTSESERGEQAWLTAVPREVLLPQEVKSVTLNGVVCE